MRIAPLSADVVTKIAAGEVIERPASVVKELLENSLDAGATRIDVEVEAGGADLIRVADNGSGIVADDLPLAFAGHATSKLQSADDLFRVSTLGFRGEALASIGSVAQVTLQSRAADGAMGAQISCDGAVLSPVRPWNGDYGTRISVANLFYNTPVRRKFLRATATEMGQVSEAFTRIALSRPGLHLTLSHHGKRVFDVPASAGLKDRIALFFGGEVSGRLYQIEASEGPVQLNGFIADPACDRGNARWQYLFVNGRWFRDRSLGHALQEAFRGLLMTGRYAVAFLYLDMPADQVDVNVHPTKAEMRFRHTSLQYQLTFRAVRERLRALDLTSKLQYTAQPTQALSASAALPWPPARPAALDRPPWDPMGLTTASSSRLPTSDHHRADVPNGGPFAGADVGGGNIHSGAGGSAISASNASGDTGVSGGDIPISSTVPQSAELDAGPIKAIQLYYAYLVLETPEGMLVIDQHALHERILFEQLRSRLREGRLEIQRMLIPEPIDLPAEEAARVLAEKESLGELGIEVEDFGGKTILLTAYPAILGHRAPAGILRAVIDHLMVNDRVPTRDHLLDGLLSVMACHAAVRAGDRLTPEEITSLIGQRNLVNDPHHCPHGRPTSLLFSRHDLDRQFRRI
jgi:DNA mismatch repair protein MutL